MLANFYPYTFDFDYVDQSRTNQIIDQIQATPSWAKIILYSYEWQPCEAVANFMSDIKHAVNREIIWVLTDSFYNHAYQQHFSQIVSNIYFIEFDLLFLHFEINVYKTSTLSGCWNKDSRQFLFLTGKPHRVNRIRLLHKFYKKNLLDCCVWSFFADDELEKKCRTYLRELDDDSYINFIDKVKKNPDGVDVNYLANADCHYDGYPFDSSLFSNTSFRVIAETMMDDTPIITEKTWITIANHHPFMIVGYPDTLLRLKQQGFKTFEQYLSIQEYDSIADDETRLDCVVDNTEFWLKTLTNYSKNIAEDIQFNYRLLCSKMQDTVNKFDKIYQQLGNTVFEKFMIFPKPNQRCNWINFYYGIKDPCWPDCWIESDFTKLPLEVQREIVHRYGHNNTINF